MAVIIVTYTCTKGVVTLYMDLSHSDPSTFRADKRADRCIVDEMREPSVAAGMQSARRIDEAASCGRCVCV